MNKMNERISVGDRVVICKRGKSMTFQAEFHFVGQHRRKSLKTKNKKVAIQRASQLDAQLLSGEFQRTARSVRIVDAIAMYLAFKEMEDRAHKTLVKYRGQLGAFREFCERRQVTRLSQVRPAIFDAFRRARKEHLHVTSRYHEAVTIKQWIKWSHSRELLSENPLRNCRLEKPKRGRPKPAPTLQEVWNILNACREPLRCHVATLAFTGMRSGEMRQLRAQDVDLGAGWIHVVSRDGCRTKTGESRDIPIHSELLPFLRRGQSTTGPWFYAAESSTRYPDGDHWINTKKLNDRLAVVLRRVGLAAGRGTGLTIHSLRHFFETHSVNAGIPQRVIDIWMGHESDRSMATHYYDLRPDDSVGFMRKVNFSRPKPPNS